MISFQYNKLEYKLLVTLFTSRASMGKMQKTKLTLFLFCSLIHFYETASHTNLICFLLKTQKT